MKFKKHESGRSMVEMLGVLAIIGVLSVGGIAGYTLAMRRHRANGVVDTFSKYALSLYTICQQKIMDGEKISIEDCRGIYLNLPFNQAGLGDLPAGVSGIDGSEFKSNSGKQDVIILSAQFDDDKLCQAVASIVGSSCTRSAVQVPIKQN